MQIQERWVNKFAFMAKHSSVSYNDLKRMDAFEFFHLCNMVEKSLQKR